MRVRVGGSVVDVRGRVGVAVVCGCVLLLILLLSSLTGQSSHDKPQVRREELAKLYFKTGFLKDSKPPVKMAMDAAKPHYDKILKLQQSILTTQDRPADSVYNINVTLSDEISMDRKVKDTRPAACLDVRYSGSAASDPSYDRHGGFGGGGGGGGGGGEGGGGEEEGLPRASVIIPFYNEALSMLLRTVHSVLNNSPDHLLNEIILVDDKSTRDYLGASFAQYINLLPKTVLIRNAKRQGLIVSRLRGSRMARGPVVVFLDAHTEANVGWLEPLLREIRDHPNTVAQPFVDGIDTGTIEYSSPPDLYTGSFSWDLRYTWLKVPEHDAKRAKETGLPYFSPTLVGCAIAVDKDYFEKIGEFDEGLKVWGGENIELGFRAWQCGGRVTTVICSRVGHVFKNFPYQFDGDREIIVAKNLMRVTETWMDSYRKYYYASARTYEFKRTELDASELESLAERRQLREKLDCKNFEWYMLNIIPEVESPPTDAIYYGEIQCPRTSACWEVLNDYQIGMNYMCYEHKIMPQNFFSLTESGLLKYKDKCVQVTPNIPILKLAECPKVQDIESHGIWGLENKGHVYGRLTVRRKNAQGTLDKYCIMQVTNVYGKEHAKAQMPEIAKCDDTNDFQIWAFTWKFTWDQVPKHVLESRAIV